ncbi:MAG: signal peptide peptidase SppA [Candidatus Marinimicrobia bacterium]|nr:signal peptide peptidase SppA [Candidatus Neomarinimicrobiota bacterium]
MKRLSLIIILSGLAFSNSYFSGLSHATSDNLDAIDMNPAGLGIDRGLQFGLGINDQFENSKRVGLGLKYKKYGASIILDEEGAYDYIIGSASYFPKANLYFGQTYSSNKDLVTGLIFRPYIWLSTGLTHNYNINDEINGLRFSTAFKPLGNRLTVSVDLFHDNLSKIKELNFSYTANINIRAMNGIHFIAGYNDHKEALFGFSLNTSSLNFLTFGNRSKTLRPNISFRYSSQIQSGIKIPSLKKTTDKKVLNFVNLTINHVFIEEPVKTKKGFNIQIPDINPFSSLLGGGQIKYYQLQDFIDKIEMITANDNVDGIVINLKSIGGGISKLMDIREALQNFKDSGKKIIIYADYISNSAYIVASVADEIYIPELSGVDLRGLHIEVEFYKDLLDTIGITYEVEQISPYKSAMDPFIRSSMSAEMKENLGQLFDDIYNDYVEAISKGRGWTLEHTKKIIDGGPYREDEAIEVGLITNTIYPDEFKKHIKKYNNKTVVSLPLHTFEKKDEYVEHWVENKDKIAVIYAIGGIQMGKSQRGSKGPSSVMGNETITRAIKTARMDKNVKGIVLRIDSGGGSALSSDLMWKEIYNTTVSDTKNIKPFVASMSSVAASGGYYIACQADKIMASSTTVTGSIGVISGRPNFSGLKSKLGIQSEGIKYGKRSDYYSGNKLWDTEERKILRDGIEHVYGKFLKRVSDGRNALDSLEVHEIGIGKVWSGTTAKKINLVDEIGNLEDAVNLTAEIAGLEKGQFQIDEYPKQGRNKGFNFGRNEMNIPYSIEFSGSLKEIQETLQSIPNFENDLNQMVIPYRIIIH